MLKSGTRTRVSLASRLWTLFVVTVLTGPAARADSVPFDGGFTACASTTKIGKPNFVNEIADCTVDAMVACFEQLETYVGCLQALTENQETWLAAEAERNGMSATGSAEEFRRLEARCKSGFNDEAAILQCRVSGSMYAIGPLHDALSKGWGR